MSFISALKHGVNNPKDIISQRGRHYIGRNINKLYHSRCTVRKSNRSGVDIFSEDWDNLIILDACRYDSFAKIKEKYELQGELESRISKGSQTPEWLWANFHNKSLYDTVYITASAQPYTLGLTERENNATHKKWSFDLKVHDLINLWNRDDLIDVIPTIRERKKDFLIPASVVAEESIKISDKYPNKRLLIHIREPHTPYAETELGEKIHNISKYPWWDKLYNKSKTEKISIEELREAYEQNVEIAVRAASKLANGLDGKTVISADHGEMLWERSFPVPIADILHPNRTYTEELVRVPWFIIDGKRREIMAEEPTDTHTGETEIMDENAEDQLEALGYLR